MKLHEIIDASFAAELCSWDEVAPYRKSLKIYFERYYRGTTMFLAVHATNTGAVGIVCPDHEVWDSFYHHGQNCGWTEEEIEEYFEQACANSFCL